MEDIQTDIINDLYIELNLPYAIYCTNPKAWIATHPNRKIPKEISYEELLNSTKQIKDEAKYQAWLKKRYESRLKYGLQDSDSDYPQYSKDKDLDDLTRKRELAREAKLYNKPLTNF